MAPKSRLARLLLNEEALEHEVRHEGREERACTFGSIFWWRRVDKHVENMVKRGV